MGSILSKLFGGNHKENGNASAQHPALMPPTAGTTQTTTTASPSGTLARSTSTSSKPNTLGIAESSSTSPPPIKPSPVNILEVEVDEEAFKETSPAIYMSTIEAKIDPSPPHPLEQFTQKTQVHLTTIETPMVQMVQTQAPIASIDSDYEEEIALLDNQEREDAVIKIQAGVRGFLVRKQIHASRTPSPPVKSKSLDDPTSMSQPDNILPPPEHFDTSAGNLTKPLLISSKRVETPIPSSPFAQDDTDYTILDTVDPQEVTEEAQMISNSEELEIFKKINEINQLLASKDEDDIEVVPEPPKTLESSVINAAISSASINTALNELDETIREQEQTLPPETDDEVVVLESAFVDNITLEPFEAATVVPQSPSVLVKAPSLDEEPETATDVDSLLSETAAAIRIQAAFRGYEVRKSLSREVSPARNFENELKDEIIEAEVQGEKAKLEPQVSEPVSIEPIAPENLPEPEPEPESQLTFDPIVESKEEIKEEEVKEKAPEPIVLEKAELIEERQTLADNNEETPQLEIQAPVINALIESIPLPVKEEPIQVTESTHQEVIQGAESKSETQEEEAQASIISEDELNLPTAQITESIESEKQSETHENIAIKDGFGTVASIVADTLVQSAVPLLDIEKSIQELEKSFDRDLLSDIVSEGSAIGEKEPTLIKIEPPTPAVQSPSVQEPSFLGPETQVPSKIPVLDKSAGKSILKEPSSPEPHTYSNLPLPSCISPMSDTTTSQEGGEESEDESVSGTPSPIPLRASSPCPVNKKRRRRGGVAKKK